MKIQVALFITLIAVAHAAGERTLQDQNWELKWTHIKDPTTQSSGFYRFMMNLPLTYTAGTQLTYPFTPSTGWSSIQHGVKLDSSYNWGISCTEAVKCSLPDPKTTSPVYFLSGSAWYNVAQATTELTLDADAPTGKRPLDINLSVYPKQTAQNNLGTAGIWGLAPDSPIWGYLIQEYDETIQNIGFTYYMLTSSSNKWFDLFSPSTPNAWAGSKIQVSANPRNLFEIKNEDFKWMGADMEQPFWTMKDVKIQMSNNMSYVWHAGDACISADADETILTTKFGDFDIALQKSICNQEQCGSGSSINSGADVIVTFTDPNGVTQQVTIPATQLAYKDKNNANNIATSFGDMSAYSGWTCAPNTEFGFGRMFLFFNQVVMTMDRNGNRNIGVNPYISRPSLSDSASANTLVAAGVGLVLFFFILMVIARSKGGVSDNQIGGSTPVEGDAVASLTEGLTAQNEESEKNQEDLVEEAAKL